MSTRSFRRLRSLRKVEWPIDYALSTDRFSSFDFTACSRYYTEAAELGGRTGVYSSQSSQSDDEVETEAARRVLHA